MLDVIITFSNIIDIFKRPKTFRREINLQDHFRFKNQLRFPFHLWQGHLLRLHHLSRWSKALVLNSDRWEWQSYFGHWGLGPLWRFLPISRFETNCLKCLRSFSQGYPAEQSHPGSSRASSPCSLVSSSSPTGFCSRSSRTQRQTSSSRLIPFILCFHNCFKAPEVKPKPSWRTCWGWLPPTPWWSRAIV